MVPHSVKEKVLDGSVKDESISYTYTTELVNSLHAFAVSCYGHLFLFHGTIALLAKYYHKNYRIRKYENVQIDFSR